MKLDVFIELFYFGETENRTGSQIGADKTPVGKYSRLSIESCPHVDINGLDSQPVLPQ